MSNVRKNFFAYSNALETYGVISIGQDLMIRWSKRSYVHCSVVKSRHCEKATKFEKNLPLVATKQPFLPSSVKTSVRFLKNFVAFSENLNFTRRQLTLILGLGWKILKRFLSNLRLFLKKSGSRVSWFRNISLVSSILRKNKRKNST